MVRTALCAVLSLVAVTGCSASSLYFTGGGTFSSTDTTDTFVSPGADFSFTFVVPSNPATNGANSTTVSFDVTPLFFSYRLNGTPVNVGQPSEITFDTASNGGGVTVNFANTELILGNSQYFTGATSAPVFSPATFSAQNFIFLDNQNSDLGAATAQLAPIPEPSSAFLVCGGFALLAAGMRKFNRIRK